MGKGGNNVNILWFNWRDIRNPDAGGAEVFTHEVCRRLVHPSYRHKITLYTSAFHGCRDEEELEGIKIVRGGNKYTVYKKAKEFYKRYGQEYDLVVDEINTRPFSTVDFVKDKPIVALIHQLAREFWFYETRFPINLIGYYFLEKYWLAKYRNRPTITVSESTKIDLESLHFKDVEVIPEGIAFRPSDTPAQKEPEPTLIFVGRLKKAKKPDDAIRAFLALKLEIPDAKLWVVGDGYMISKLKEMAAAPTLNMNSTAKKGNNASRPTQDYDDNSNNGIFFFGKVSNEKKLELMSRAHILLVPGVREGWGLVVTEANAMGTPAVAYDIPGLRDSVLNHETGVLVQKDDPTGMAIDAGMLLTDKKKLDQYSKKAIEYARGFSWDTTAAKFALILEHNYAHYSRAIAESRNSPYPEASQKGAKIK